MSIDKTIDKIEKEIIVEAIDKIIHNLEENAMEKAIEAHYKALEHSYAMLEQYSNAKLEYEANKLVMGPLYGQLRDKYCEAVAASEAAKVAELAAEKALNEAEAEYFKNHKCTFCGDLDSVCGGDHSEEMREICRESERRY